MSTRLSDYQYELPPELIAQRPPARRDACRLMVLHRGEDRIEHRQFSELASFIGPGDLLVLNNTRVARARHFSDDGKVEFLFLEQIAPRRWSCLVKPGKKMRRGGKTRITGAEVRIEEVSDDGSRVLATDSDIDFLDAGVMPLPPYVRRSSDADDVARYQTVFAAQRGAVAAPTAGLHFTEELLDQLWHAFVTLHVGPGTFRPVHSEDIREHQMHAERFSVSAAAAETINSAESIIAVGTTSVRVLESARRDAGKIVAQSGTTNIFIHPPGKIQHVDALLTNFHLPRSTLLMLVSAFAGREFVLRAYEEAVRERYRFYSYGDCMLIL
ncbi:MAG: tRNA preQ1(34) S-adenosylmethionine ribosyltransferase-isomerase QueA [Chthoniobacterales bacterium]